jgi:hypothetical protein
MRELSIIDMELLKLPLRWFELRNIGDISAKFQSIQTIQTTVTGKFIEVLYASHQEAEIASKKLVLSALCPETFHRTGRSTTSWSVATVAGRSKRSCKR